MDNGNVKIDDLIYIIGVKEIQIQSLRVELERLKKLIPTPDLEEKVPV